MSEVLKYGVLDEKLDVDEIGVMEEEIRLLGYTTLDAGYTQAELDRFSESFDKTEIAYKELAQNQGINLDALNETDSIRLLPSQDPIFWSIVFNTKLQTLISRLLGNYFILNQVNGLINRKNNSKYHQSKYHRDLPYQHFTSSKPLAINALFAIDDFTIENGATRVIPASHHREAFPPTDLILRNEKQVAVKRGTFVVLDCMLYHAGSTNKTQKDRRAINHVFTIPILRQQFHLPSVLGNGEDFTDYQKKVLGYGLEEFNSLSAWFDERKQRID